MKKRTEENDKKIDEENKKNDKEEEEAVDRGRAAVIKMKEDNEKQVTDQKADKTKLDETKKDTKYNSNSANDWVANMPAHHLDEGKYQASFHWCGAKECPIAV